MTTLSELQRTLQQVCTAEDPSPEDLAKLGNPTIFYEYRRMVRRRIEKELKIAFKRTVAATGESFFENAFRDFMANTPPRTRFFHRLPIEFCERMLPHFQASTDIPAYCADLLQYEAKRREVANRLYQQKLPSPAERDDFNFEQPVVLNPTLAFLKLAHSVHVEHGQPPRKELTPLLLFRPSEQGRVRHFRVDAVTFELLQHVAEARGTMAEAVQAISHRHRFQVDANYLEGLCGVLAEFIDQQLIQGTRSQAP